MFSVQGIPALDDNYIWLISRPDRAEAVIVDPGDAGPVLQALSAQGLTPTAILITHHHYDHVGGIAELLGHYPIPVYGPARETIPYLSHPCGDGERVTLPALGGQCRVLEVPGHTAGHLAYDCANPGGPGLLFSGDTLFTAGCGRLFEGTAAQMYHSLCRLRALADDTLVYCAHEYTAANLLFARTVEPDNATIARRQQETEAARRQGLATVPAPLGVEKATNPFLRFDHAEVVRAAEAFAGRPLHDAAEVFTVLRYWKDTLD